jgi:hypothetical protein
LKWSASGDRCQSPFAATHSRTVDQLTALLDMLACTKGFENLDDSAQETILGVADDLAYQVKVAGARDDL